MELEPKEPFDELPEDEEAMKKILVNLLLDEEEKQSNLTTKEEII